jgi:hypothetical protein
LAVEDEKRSGPVLDGLFDIVVMLLEAGHEGFERNSKGAGESIDEQDMVSKSGVSGSRYGFVVLMKETTKAECVSRPEMR